MIRATMTEPGVIRFDEVPPPVPGPDQVLVRVRRIGVCGSDIHVWHGKHPYTSYPVVQGHEFSAEVDGKLVTAPPQITCGECPSCRRGEYHICEHLKVMGFQAPGVAQEYVALPRSLLMPLPENFTPELGALVEPVAVAVHAVGRAGDVAGQTVLVLGAGPIGNLVAQVARWRGASRVVITDISDYRLDIARRCGIEASLDAFTPDATFECAGVEETANQAIRSARKGSIIVVVGVFSELPRIDLGLVQDRELRLVGTLMYRRNDYADAIRCLAEGGIVTEPLLTTSYPFRQYADAYSFIDSHRDRVMKVMIDLDRMA